MAILPYSCSKYWKRFFFHISNFFLFIKITLYKIVTNHVIISGFKTKASLN